MLGGGLDRLHSVAVYALRPNDTALPGNGDLQAELAAPLDLDFSCRAEITRYISSLPLIAASRTTKNYDY